MSGDLVRDLQRQAQVDLDIKRRQDVVLIAITDQKMTDRAWTALRELPPWRAVLLARVGHLAGAISVRDRDDLVREARLVGGYGALRTWERHKQLLANRVLRACPKTKFPDGTHCGEHGWHAKNCPERKP
jgi:hypothetical protein